MAIQQGWFTPRAPIVQTPVLKRDSARMAIADADPVTSSARLLIASATEFVPRQPAEENRCINSIYTDRTIIELSIFLLFQLDFYLSTRKDADRDAKIRKSIRYQADFFDRLFPGSGYDKLFYSRIQLYGITAHHNKNFMSDTLQLLKEIILDTHKNGKHRVGLQFLYKDDYHLAARLDYHLKVYFERYSNDLLTIYKTVRGVEQARVLS